MTINQCFHVLREREFEPTDDPVIFRENRGDCRAERNSVPQICIKYRWMRRRAVVRGRGRRSAHTCVVSSVAGESWLLAREAGCSWMVGKRDECKADRRRGTKYETNSWNDGEERAREREEGARGKQLDRVASNAAQRSAVRRRMLRRGGSRGRRRKRWGKIGRDR